MKKNLIAYLIILFALSSCFDNEYSPRETTFLVQSRTEHTIKEVELNLRTHENQETFHKIEGLGPYQHQITKLNLKDYPTFRWGDAYYEVVARIDTVELRKSFGYIDNGYDSDSRYITVHISDSLITVK